ncbi:hypothetical protein [Rathayibacter oskolensis]|nr:hypothetical protein [Rathayibacter oskolensis]
MTTLTDSLALAWLAERGVDADAPAPLLLHADEAAEPGFAVRRLAHGAASLRRPSSVAPGLVLLLVPLEGTAALSARGVAEQLSRGRFAALPGGAASTLRTRAQSSRLELLVRVPAPLRRPVVAFSTALPVVVATANAVLETRLGPADPAFAGLRAALEQLAAAVLASASTP